jgi:hypothetical protein
MACERHRDALSDLAAGAVASPALEAHLASCEACRVEREELRRALAAADDELGNLLSAAPSPELAARIRTAVSGAPAASAWRPGFWLAFGGATAALLVALGLLAQRKEQSVSTAVATQTQHAADAVEGPAPAVEPTTPATASTTPVAPAIAAVRSERVRAAVSFPSPGAPRTLAAEPEVLVPAGEAEALLRFAAHLRQRSVTPRSLLVADLNAPLAESTDVQIRPIEIVPLDPEEDSGAE